MKVAKLSGRLSFLTTLKMQFETSMPEARPRALVAIYRQCSMIFDRFNVNSEVLIGLLYHYTQRKLAGLSYPYGYTT